MARRGFDECVPAAVHTPVFLIGQGGTDSSESLLQWAFDGVSVFFTSFTSRLSPVSINNVECWKRALCNGRVYVV